MKYLIIMMISIFLTSTLFANKEAKCKQAMKHILEVTLNSPQMKPMLKDPKTAKKIKENMAKQMAPLLKGCIEKFDEDENKCIMKSTNLKDMRSCKSKGKVNNSDPEKVNKCKMAIKHVYNLTMESPQMKPILKDPKMAETLKKSMMYQMKQGLSKCVNKFEEESYKCIMKATKFEDLTKCKKKK